MASKRESFKAKEDCCGREKASSLVFCSLSGQKRLGEPKSWPSPSSRAEIATSRHARTALLAVALGRWTVSEELGERRASAGLTPWRAAELCSEGGSGPLWVETGRGRAQRPPRPHGLVPRALPQASPTVPTLKSARDRGSGLKTRSSKPGPGTAQRQRPPPRKPHPAEARAPGRSQSPRATGRGRGRARAALRHDSRRVP